MGAAARPRPSRRSRAHAASSLPQPATSARAASSGAKKRRRRVIGLHRSEDRKSSLALGDGLQTQCLCWSSRRFCAASSRRRPAQAAKRPTVAGELKRLAAEGAITPEDAAAAPRDLRRRQARKVKPLTGARKVELGGVVKDLEDMAARDQFRPSRLPALFLTLQRNVEWWTAQPLLRYGQRVELPRLRARLPVLPRPRAPDPVARHVRQAQRLLDAAASATTRAPSALLDEALPLATERAGGLAWEYLFPFDGQAPPWVSSLAQGTGLQAMARSATRLNRQADVFPIALRGLGIFQTAPPAGVRVRRRRRRALPAVLGAAAAEDPQRLHPVARRALRLRRADRRRDRALAVRLRRPRRARGGPDVRHRRLVAVLARLDQARVRPRLPQAAARLPRPAVRAHDGGGVLQREPALHELPDDAAGGRGAAAHAAPEEVRASCASSSRRSRA